MFIDGRQIAPGSTLDAEVCIIGGGPAGIAIARELATTSISVILVESGGWRPNKLTQSLNQAELASQNGHPPPEMYRERRFGGSSTIWGGRCVPLTRQDFERRSHVANSGWPISPSPRRDRRLGRNARIARRRNEIGASRPVSRVL